jgi:hypothetical protein
VGADQIAEIHPAVVEVLQAHADGEGWCATFEVTGDPDRWIQVTATELNLAYPHDEAPSALLAARRVAGAEGLRLHEWEAGRFATFGFEAELDSRAVARLVDSLFQAVLGCEDTHYAVDVELLLLDGD